MLKVFTLFFVMLISTPAEADTALAYISPSNKLGGAIASGISNNLVRRGFAANDPRIAQTVSAVASRLPIEVAAAGTGATWISTMSKLSPWVTAGMVIYAGVTWYQDLQGKVYLAPPGSTTGVPIFSNGTIQGQPCWGVAADCFGSPQEALSYQFWTTTSTYPTAQFGVPTLTQNSATQYTAQYNYSIPPLGLNNYSGTKTITSHNSTLTCPAGSGYSGTGTLTCVSASLATSPYANAPVQSYTLQVAYDNLSNQAKASTLSPDVVADFADRIWSDAATQTGYSGVPFSASTPVSNTDTAPAQAAHPSDWPITSDISSAVPTATNPIASPTTNPNAVSSPTSSTKVDLGTDPGIQSPTLETPPTGLFQPIQNLLIPWLNWQVPAHSTNCPTWQASPSFGGQVINIDISYHCTLLAEHYDEIYNVFMIIWLVTAAFLILSA